MPPSAGDVAYYEGNIVEFTVATGQTIAKGDIVAITGDWEISQAGGVDKGEEHKAVGVALNGGGEGTKVEVLTMAPIVYVTNDGGVSAGDFLTPSGIGGTAGRVATLNVPQDLVKVVVGLAIEGAGDGEEGAMMLMHAIASGGVTIF